MLFQNKKLFSKINAYFRERELPSFSDIRRKAKELFPPAIILSILAGTAISSFGHGEHPPAGTDHGGRLCWA